MAFNMSGFGWRLWRGARAGAAAGLCGLALFGGGLAGPPSAQAQTAQTAPGTAQQTTPTPATAAPPAPPALESFFGHPDLTQPRLSPSGRWLAVLVRGQAPKQRNRLVVLDLDDAAKAKVLGSFSDADIAQVWWVGDEHLVFNVIDLQAGSAVGRFAPGLFSIARADGTLRELVKLRNDFVVDGTGRVDRRLEYNHWLLHVPQVGAGGGGGTEVIVGEVQFDGSGQITNVVPKRLDVQSGRVRSLAYGMPEAARHWIFDAAGEPRVAVAGIGGLRRVHWRAPGQDGWTLLLEGQDLRMPWRPHSLDAAGQLYVTTGTGPGGTRELRRFDFTTGKPAAAPLVTVQGFDFAGSLVSEVSGGRMLGVRTDGDAETTVWTDARMKTVQAEVDRRIPGHVNRIDCRRCDSEERVLVIQSWSDRDPGSLYVWRGSARPIELVGRTMKAVDPARMATLDLHRIRARDGLDLPVWVTSPQAQAQPQAQPPSPVPRPAIVLLHGGPWVRGGHWRWDAMPQFLASRGYVVIEPEFRGSTGYGDRHFRAGWKQWGRAMQDDVADAVQWATVQKLIDPQRVCIAGASYGGYATLMGLVRHPELYRCGAAWVAVTEPRRLLESSWWWRDDVSDEARQYSLPVLLADIEKDAALLTDISPVQQAARIQAPLLLAFGAQDRRVPLVHGNLMREALQRQGGAPEWIVYPDEGHGWRRLENQHDFARRLEAFFARHLQ